MAARERGRRAPHTELERGSCHLEARQGLLRRIGDGEERIELGELEERPKVLIEAR
jgi:hypothetical protein